ncbi:hypothetical protein BFL35_04745 [Clavibacter michiganensis]|nr:hypothetical protein BFL35_04745 [Clavibacter michiganensis]
MVSIQRPSTKTALPGSANSVETAPAGVIVAVSP